MKENIGPEEKNICMMIKDTINSNLYGTECFNDLINELLDNEKQYQKISGDNISARNVLLSLEYKQGVSSTFEVLKTLLKVYGSATIKDLYLGEIPTKKTIYSGSVGMFEKEFSFKIKIVEGEGDCAILASPFESRNEICMLLLQAIKDPYNRPKLAEEIGEALCSNEKFLTKTNQMCWDTFQSINIAYDNAYNTYQNLVKDIQLLLKSKFVDIEDTSLLEFLQDKNEYEEMYINLKMIKETYDLQKNVFDKNGERRYRFLCCSSVCQEYINNVVGKEKQWIGKGCLYLAAKEKKINLYIWKEEKDSRKLQFDKSYSCVDFKENYHVVYRHGAIHYDCLQETTKSPYEDIISFNPIFSSKKKTITPSEVTIKEDKTNEDDSSSSDNECK